MHVQLLIDGIVRQTTVLLAELSTTSGARAPLAHLADQVFVELAREIENQGVGRQVVADMFGMALRSYQKKVQRLTASATEQQRTLWQAVFEFVEREQPQRGRVFERFARDGRREVAAVLADLVRSGLLYVSGSGDNAVYGPTDETVRERVQHQYDLEALANVLWLHVFRAGEMSRDALAATTKAEPEQREAALTELLQSGRVAEHEGMLTAANLVLPVGAEQGWEAAVLHHFTTVAVAIAAKVRSGAGGASEDDRTGGSTFTFELAPGHPFEERVYGLLPAIRAQVQALWDEVSRHNNAHPPAPEGRHKVSFYFGQTAEGRDDDA